MASQFRDYPGFPKRGLPLRGWPDLAIMMAAFVATTVAPTTLPPTTLVPTTLAPTTISTTAAPTTTAPTTLPPTTLPPTTLPPTTLAPTTLVPTAIPTTAVPSGNDFSTDPNCVALYKFESGALLVDSKDSNTLTDVGGVGESVGDHKEGSCAADFETSGTTYLYRTDANLSSDFPFKSGTSNNKLSFTVWFKIEEFSPGYYNTIVSKYNTNAARSFLVCFDYQSPYNTLYFWLGYNSGNSAEIVQLSSTALTTGRWYHLGFTYDDSTKGWKCRVWDDVASSVIINASGNTTNNISYTDMGFIAGAFYVNDIVYGPSAFDGLQDELVIFNDILTVDEIDLIRAGNYGIAATTLIPTTLASTTLPPTTLAPTTPSPTTLAPTTLAPTLPPTTLPPTTPAPTTLPPTTVSPTTLAPTPTPTTLAPTTLVTTLAPTTTLTTVSPTTEVPAYICSKYLDSPINDELLLSSPITKEMILDGNLCW